MVVKLREVEAHDIKGIKRIIRETWDWASLIEDEKVLDATVGLYLNQVLYEATFSRVAVDGSKVLGVVFGSTERKSHVVYRMLQDDGTAHAITLLGAPEVTRKSIYEYMSKTRDVYEQLIEGIENEYDGTLDFLILSKDARGMGIGKDLWLALKDYFINKRARKIYLYSDTDCNAGFYEHMGFNKRREQETTYNFGVADYPMTMFLFEYGFDY